MDAEAITIRQDRREGDDALIVELHRLGYANEDERFRDAFADFVAETVAEGNLGSADAGRVWFAERDDRPIGCAALLNRDARGQLRWVVLTEEGRGLGLGRKLVELALAYARDQRHEEVFLETTDGLDASMALYEKLGFTTTHDAPEDLWHGRAS